MLYTKITAQCDAVKCLNCYKTAENYLYGKVCRFCHKREEMTSCPNSEEFDFLISIRDGVPYYMGAENEKGWSFKYSERTENLQAFCKECTNEMIYKK